MGTTFFKRIGIVALLCMAAPSFAIAAFVGAESPSPVKPGSLVEVAVFLDTEGATLNAIEGELTASSGFELKDVNDAGSSVLFWIERPRIEGAKIRFSGITPGGISGKVLLFSVSGAAKQEGEYRLVFSNLNGYAHDGEGTGASVRGATVRVTVSSVGNDSTVEVVEDFEIPESFVPVIATDPTLFDGQYFVAFATQDKRSGIDRYEVAEKMGFRRFSYGNLPWTVAESPQLLADQSLRSNVYVKAIDKRGNERVEVLSPANPPLIYNYSFVFAILLVLAALLYFFYRRVRGRHAID